MNTYNQHIRIEEDGSQELYPFDYLEFYESNIHPYEDFKLGNESKRIYEGITASEFRKKHKAGFLNVMQEVLNDKRLEKLQEELETEEKQVCMFNLYILAMFLVERCRTRYVFLLKPTIQETLSALNNVSKITFTNRDGSIAESTSDILIQTLLDALEANKECDTDTCQVEKVVAWDKVANNSVMQSYFVHDLSAFLHEYFPVKRKKDAQISTKEVELILYLMKLFGLSKEELTNKRYWQLMNTYERIDKRITDLGEFSINGKTVTMPLLFIPYSMWDNGKIDWIDKDLPRFNGEIGHIIKF